MRRVENNRSRKIFRPNDTKRWLTVIPKLHAAIWPHSGPKYQRLNSAQQYPVYSLTLFCKLLRQTGQNGEIMASIMLAEDDEDMRRFLAKALEKAGHDVVSFSNGAMAYEALLTEKVELLLTDIVMPEMDGIELARRAAELDPSLRVMFITGFAAVALRPDSNAPKDAKVLSKPFHLKDLVAEVEKMLTA